MTVPPDPSSSKANPIRVTYDPRADAAYVRLADFQPGAATTQIFVEGIPSPADIVLDFNSAGQLVGVEVVGARSVLSPDLLAIAEPPQQPQV